MEERLSGASSLFCSEFQHSLPWTPRDIWTAWNIFDFHFSTFVSHKPFLVVFCIFFISPASLQWTIFGFTLNFTVATTIQAIEHFLVFSWFFWIKAASFSCLDSLSLANWGNEQIADTLKAFWAQTRNLVSVLQSTATGTCIKLCHRSSVKK